MPSYQIVCADVLAWAKEYKRRIERGEAEPFHALCCDPPWEYAFMGKSWDSTGITFQPETWSTLADILHPGAFLMVFAGSRGWHRLAVALEDAGLVLQPSIFVWGLGVVEVPFCLGWLQSQAFPKATRIDTKLDEREGKLGKREIVGSKRSGLNMNTNLNDDNWHKIGSGEEGKRLDITAPATPLARAWEGHRYGGQVLKDCLSPIIVAQKPWEKPRLDCIVRTGAGAMNVDAGRISAAQDYNEAGWGPRYGESAMGYMGGHQTRPWVQKAIAEGRPVKDSKPSPNGRWPSNFALVHSPGCVRAGTRRVKKQDGGTRRTGGNGYEGGWGDARPPHSGYADSDGMETVSLYSCQLSPKDVEWCTCEK